MRITEAYLENGSCIILHYFAVLSEIFFLRARSPT